MPATIGATLAARPRGEHGTSRSSRDRASAGPRSPGRRHPPRTYARSPATNVHPHVCEEQQRDHLSSTIHAVGAMNAARPLLHRLQHKPHEMPLRQPITRVGRHQERLLTIARQEVHNHPRSPQTRPGQTRSLRDTHRRVRASRLQSDSPIVLCLPSDRRAVRAGGARRPARRRRDSPRSAAHGRASGSGSV